MADTAFLILCLLLGLLAAGGAIFLVYRSLARLPPEAEAPPAAPDTYAFLTLDEALPRFDRRRPVLEAQSPEWRAAFAASGQKLLAGGVRTILYAHGTFVGSDPIGLATLLQDLHPAVGKRLAELARDVTRKSNLLVTRDLGNFSPAYLRLCQQGLHPDLRCLEFAWSSANNHAARLEGALALMLSMIAAVDRGFDLRRERFLVLGHSHAGQVFALFTQLLGSGPLQRALAEVVDRYKLLPPKRLVATTKVLKTAAVDFVTLGTSPIYPWCLGPTQRLLHIINHRGHGPEGGDLSGALQTRTGDYIQQFGRAGSDTVALTRKERDMNRRLNDLLGLGTSMAALVANLRNRRRLSAAGFSYLVDFRDESAWAPNVHKTFFGHGVYTRYDVMLYLHQLIAAHFYGGGPLRSTSPELRSPQP